MPRQSTKILYRHGDVLVSPVASIPTAAVKCTHVVLAEGEMTGHAHRIAEARAAELYELNGDRFLRVLAAQATLVHEEHGPIVLNRGDYRVWRQREYSPRGARVVRD